MNDLPVPRGDWQEEYDRRNRKYNGILAAGIAIFVGTITVVKSSGVIHLNSAPPKSID